MRSNAVLLRSREETPAALPWDLDALAHALESQGHAVHVQLVAPGEQPPPVPGAVVHAFGRGAAEAVRDEAPWVYTPTADVAEAWVDLRDEVPRDPVVADAAAVGVASTDHARVMNRRGASHERVHVLPLGLDTEVYSRSGPSANRTGRWRIVVEATHPADGVLDVVQALETMPDAEIICMIGVPRDRLDTVPHLRAVRDAAEHAGVRERIAFYSPAEDRERAWMLRSADVVVSVPLVDGVAPLVLQAMGCGRPVVATPVGAARDLVVHGVTGYHVTPGDGRALQSVLRSLAAEPFAAEALGSAGADRALSRYTWDRVATAFAGLWASASGESGPEQRPDTGMTGVAGMAGTEPGSDGVLDRAGA